MRQDPNRKENFRKTEFRKKDERKEYRLNIGELPEQYREERKSKQYKNLEKPLLPSMLGMGAVAFAGLYVYQNTDLLDKAFPLEHSLSDKYLKRLRSSINDRRKLMANVLDEEKSLKEVITSATAIRKTLELPGSPIKFNVDGQLPGDVVEDIMTRHDGKAVMSIIIESVKKQASIEGKPIDSPDIMNKTRDILKRIETLETVKISKGRYTSDDYIKEVRELAPEIQDLIESYDVSVPGITRIAGRIQRMLPGLDDITGIEGHSLFNYELLRGSKEARRRFMSPNRQMLPSSYQQPEKTMDIEKFVAINHSQIMGHRSVQEYKRSAEDVKKVTLDFMPLQRQTSNKHDANQLDDLLTNRFTMLESRDSNTKPIKEILRNTFQEQKVRRPGYTQFSPLYDQYSEVFINNYVDEAKSLWFEYGQNDTKEYRKALKKLNQKFIGSMTISQETYITGRKNRNLERQVHQYITINNANHTAIRDIDLPTNLDKVFADQGFDPVIDEFGMARLSTGTHRAPIFEVMNSGALGSKAFSGTDAAEGQLRTFLNLSSKIANQYYQSPYRGIDMFDYLSPTQSRGFKPVHGMLDGIKAMGKQSENFLFKAMMQPHKISKGERNVVGLAGKSMKQVARIMSELRRTPGDPKMAGKAMNLFIWDTETFGMSEQFLGDMFDLAFTEEGLPDGYQGHMYSFSFGGVKISKSGMKVQSSDDILKSITDPDDREFMKWFINKESAFFANDKNLSKKVVKRKGVWLVREPIQNLAKAFDEGTVSDAQATEMFNQIKGIMPTEYLEEEKGFREWVRYLAKNDNATIGFKDAQKARAILKKYGAHGAFNAPFDDARFGLDETTNDILGHIMTMGSYKGKKIGGDGTRIRSLLSEKVRRNVSYYKELFEVTDDEVNSVLKQMYGGNADEIVRTHDSLSDVATEIVIYNKAMQKHFNLKSDKQSDLIYSDLIKDLDNIGSILHEVGEGKYRNNDPRKLLELFKNGNIQTILGARGFLSGHEGVGRSILALSAEQSAKGNFLFDNIVMKAGVETHPIRFMSYFQEASGPHKQLYQAFNSLVSWRINPSEMSTDDIIRDNIANSLESYGFKEAWANIKQGVGYGYSDPKVLGGIRNTRLVETIDIIETETSDIAGMRSLHLGNIWKVGKGGLGNIAVDDMFMREIKDIDELTLNNFYDAYLPEDAKQIKGMINRVKKSARSLQIAREKVSKIKGKGARVITDRLTGEQITVSGDINANRYNNIIDNFVHARQELEEYMANKRTIKGFEAIDSGGKLKKIGSRAMVMPEWSDSGELIGIKYTTARDLDDIAFKVMVGGNKGMVQSVGSAGSDFQQLIESISRTLGIRASEGGYLVTSGNVAAKKKRYGQQFKAYINTAAREHITKAGKTGNTADMKEFINAYIPSAASVGERRHELFKARMLMEYGFLDPTKENDAKMIRKVNKWMSAYYDLDNDPSKPWQPVSDDFIGSGEAAVRKHAKQAFKDDVAYAKYNFDFMKRAYVRTGMHYTDKDIMKMQKWAREKKLDFIKAHEIRFTNSFIDYKKYKNLQDDEILTQFIKDQGVTYTDGGKKYLPKFIQKIDGDGLWVSKVLQDTRLLERSDIFNKSITPYSGGALIKFKPEKDLGLMAITIANNSALSVDDAYKEANHMMNTYGRDISIYRAFAGIKKGFKKTGLKGIDDIVNSESLGHRFDTNMIEDALQDIYRDTGLSSENIMKRISGNTEDGFSMLSQIVASYDELSKESEIIKDNVPNIYWHNGPISESDLRISLLAENFSKDEIDDIIAEQEGIRSVSMFLKYSKHGKQKEELRKLLSAQSDDIMGVVEFSGSYMDKGKSKTFSIVFSELHNKGAVDVLKGKRTISTEVMNLDAVRGIQVMQAFKEYKESQRQGNAEKAKMLATKLKQKIASFEKTQSLLAYKKGGPGEAISFNPYGMTGKVTALGESIRGDTMGLAGNYKTFLKSMDKAAGGPNNDLYNLYNTRFSKDDVKKLIGDKGGYRILIDKDEYIPTKGVDLADDVIKNIKDVEGVEYQAISRKDLVKIMKNKEKSHYIKLGGIYSTHMASNPYSMQMLPGNMYLSSHIKEGSIHATNYMREIIMKDFDGDRASLAFLGLNRVSNGMQAQGKIPFSAKAVQHYQSHLEKGYAERMNQLSKVINDLDSGKISKRVNGVTRVKIDDIETRKLLAGVFGDKVLNDLTEDELLAGFKRYMPELVGDNGMIYALEGDKLSAKFLLTSPNLLEGAPESVQNILAGTADVALTQEEALAGKVATPTAYALRTGTSAAYKLLDKKERELLPQFGALSLLEYEEVIKSIKKGDPNSNIVQTILDQDEVGLARHFMPFTKENTEEFRALTKAMKLSLKHMHDNQLLDTIRNSNTLSMADDIFGIPLSKKVLGESMADKFRFMMDPSGIKSVNEVSFSGMMGKMAKDAKMGRNLALAGAVAAGLVLVNPNQTPWYDQKVEGAGGESRDRMVRWSYMNKTNYFHRELNTKATNAHVISEMMNMQQKMYMTREWKRKSEYYDSRIRDYKGKFFSF